jgi:hypothetical protein
VGTFVVEDLDKFVEARLLLKKIRRPPVAASFFKVDACAHDDHFAAEHRVGSVRGQCPGAHHTASLLRLNKACAEANGTPLSLRMLAGRLPLKAAQTQKAYFPGSKKGLQVSRNRPAWS